ncbi:MAG: hypothetical protein ABIR47_17260 [Candidatus Kapaibacterium sp.]
MQHRAPFTAVICAVAVSSFGLLAAMPANAQNALIPWSVVGTGGVIGASDGSTVISATIGQPIIGPASDGPLQLQQGFWLPIQSVADVEQDVALTSEEGMFRLHNFPNPVSTSTTIRYTLPEMSHVTLEIVDLVGKHVARLVDDWQNQGEQQTLWNGMNASGEPASGGMYLYILTVEPAGSSGRLTGGGVRTERRKMLIVR